MSKKGLLISSLALIPVLLLSGCDTTLKVFDPKGPAARDIMHLINWSLLLMTIIVVAVIVLFVVFVWKYRETANNKNYEPEEHGSTKLEITWTMIPVIIVILLTIPTVTTIYSLEKVPKGYENKKPITINVTSADWKWIFSYPEQGIETVNYVNIPAGTPVKFKLTSAGTMQSFWVPELGGQKYNMAKMQTQLILTADQVGEYMGANTNFNGKGYANDNFTVEAKSQQDFDKWVADVKNNAPKLTEKKYVALLKPSNLGRETFSNTHLAFVDHSKMDSKTYTFPELYKNHDYPGQIFKEPKDQPMNMKMDGQASEPLKTNNSKVCNSTTGGEN
jgi:cytochrome aa3-600 menaquinol oxidase subunit 2